MYLKEIQCHDGQKLIAHCFEPAKDPLAAILIVPAMGAVQSYYFALATWLAEQGFIVLTFDYRGIGASQQGHLRHCRASIIDWAEKDCAAMIDALEAVAKGRPLFWVGHSLAGQILAFVPNLFKMKQVISITSGSGYWRDNAWSLKWKVLWLWYVIAPLAISIYGYFPGKSLRKVGDLPRNVMLQWRRWCLNPDYAAGAEHAYKLYQAVQIPIISLSVTDDELLSQKSINQLLSFYSEAPIYNHIIAPEDIGVKKIGHFGFFKKQYTDSLWRKYLLPTLTE